MASKYTPTNVTAGFGAEVLINKNFTDLKAAIDDMLNKAEVIVPNSMLIDLDMGGRRIINLPNAVLPTDPILLSQLNSLVVQEVVDTVTFATVMNIDVDTTSFAKTTLTANATINFINTSSDGQPILFLLKQDGTGSRTITWDTRIRFGIDIPAIVLSTDPNKKDYIMFRYDAVDDKYDVMAVNRGF